jgi:hypothetical protein
MVHIKHNVKARKLNIFILAGLMDKFKKRRKKRA